MNTRKAWLAIATIAVSFSLVAGGFYWRHMELYPDTDNAYVGANVVQIASEINGRVSRVYVRDNGLVQEGSLLFELDVQPLKIALERAEAKLAIVQQQRDADEAALLIAQAAVKRSYIEADNVEKGNLRINKLVKKHYVSEEMADNAVANLKVAIAASVQSQAQEHQARINLGDINNQSPRLKEAIADINQARLNLAHSSIRAPASGYVTKLSLRPGDIIDAGVALFAIIDKSEWWVDANFKETNIGRIQTGQEATIHVDSYPGVPFRGVVQSISRGSGAAFSLFPPENATGNWVKVTQRVSVRVKILNPDSLYPLRIGTSAIVTINTSAADNRKTVFTTNKKDIEAQK